MSGDQRAEIRAKHPVFVRVYFDEMLVEINAGHGNNNNNKNKAKGWEEKMWVSITGIVYHSSYQ